MSDKIKVTLLGVGNMGKNHLRILSMLKDVDLKYIYDVDSQVLKGFSEQYKVDYTMDLEEALSAADAVIIATPTSTHFDYFVKAAEFAKFIFIEKPLADTEERGKQIKEIATQKGIKVQVGFIERFNPAISELKRIISEDSVINTDFTRTNRLSSRISDVNVILDLMIHDLDLALYLNGPVESVFAYGVKENDLVALASATLRHKNGAFSRVIASRITEKKARRIQVTSENAFIDCELLRKEIIINKQSEVSQEEGKPYTISSIEQQVEVRPQEALLLELQSFIDLCKGKQVDVPDIEAGQAAMELCSRIEEQI